MSLLDTSSGMSPSCARVNDMGHAQPDSDMKRIDPV
jgi:hypothetical protein